jgi:hypothetical protein
LELYVYGLLNESEMKVTAKQNSAEINSEIISIKAIVALSSSFLLSLSGQL